MYQSQKPDINEIKELEKFKADFILVLEEEFNKLKAPIHSTKEYTELEFSIFEKNIQSIIKLVAHLNYEHINDFFGLLMKALYDDIPVFFDQIIDGKKTSKEAFQEIMISKDTVVKTLIQDILNTSFIEVIAKGQSFELLVNLGANPKATDLHGYTALMLAATRGKTDFVKMLIGKYDANIEDKNNCDHTTLEELTKAGFVSSARSNPDFFASIIDSAKLLISLGADVTNVTNVDFLEIGYSNINAENQIQYMCTFANEKLDQVKTLKLPFSKDFDLCDKISKIKTKVDRISSTAVMTLEEKKEVLGKINHQLLKLEFLERKPERLQKEYLEVESINEAFSTSTPKYDLSITQIISDLAGSLRSEAEGILSDILLVPIAPTAESNAPSNSPRVARISHMIETASSALNQPSQPIPTTSTTPTTRT